MNCQMDCHRRSHRPRRLTRKRSGFCKCMKDVSASLTLNKEMAAKDVPTKLMVYNAFMSTYNTLYDGMVNPAKGRHPTAMLKVGGLIGLKTACAKGTSSKSESKTASTLSTTSLSNKRDHPDCFRVNQRPAVVIDALEVLSHFPDAHVLRLHACSAPPQLHGSIFSTPPPLQRAPRAHTSISPRLHAVARLQSSIAPYLHAPRSVSRLHRSIAPCFISPRLHACSAPPEPHDSTPPRRYTYGTPPDLPIAIPPRRYTCSGPSSSTPPSFYVAAPTAHLHSLHLDIAEFTTAVRSPNLPVLIPHV